MELTQWILILNWFRFKLLNWINTEHAHVSIKTWNNLKEDKPFDKSKRKTRPSTLFLYFSLILSHSDALGRQVRLTNETSLAPKKLKSYEHKEEI